MKKNWLASIVVLGAIVGVGMSIAPTTQVSGFLSNLKAGMSVSLTQDTDTNGVAFLYIPSEDEAASGDYWTITEVGADFIQCKSGSAVWRVPASAIGRMSWND